MQRRIRAVSFLAFAVICGAATSSGASSAAGQAANAGQSSAPAKPDPKTLKAARKFVDGFYDLYLSKIVDEDDMPSPYDAVEDEGRLFSPRLRRELKEDFDAQDASPDEIVGLDFDPFLNSQDPCDEYEVGDATRRGTAYWVPVYGICDGKKHDAPDLYAEVAPAGSGAWQFVNFHYPDGGDLLGILKSLRAERRKAPKDTPGMTKS